jgi:hypothetical protein
MKSDGSVGGTVVGFDVGLIQFDRFFAITQNATVIACGGGGGGAEESIDG